MLQLPIGAIPVGSWVPSIGEPSGRPLAMLRPSASLSSALNLLIQGMFVISVKCGQKENKLSTEEFVYVLEVEFQILSGKYF